MIKRFFIKYYEIIWLCTIIALFLFLALYHLDSLPGEWYGDISIVNNYVLAIINQNWPFTFILSAGPLYHYIITPIILFLGVSFYSYKIASVMIAGGGVLITYIFARSLSKSSFISLLTTYILTSSFWYLAFTRLGNSQIFIPLLCSGVLYLAYLFNTLQKIKYLLFGTVVASLGLFVYPQTFILPIIFFLVIILYNLFYFKKNIVHIAGLILLFSLPSVIFFTFIIVKQAQNFSTGYIGSKIWVSHSAAIVILNFFNNYLKTFLMFFIHGDNAFRTNVPHSQELDIISAIFFVVGIVFILFKKRNFFLYTIFPILLLVIPSLAPGIPPIEIPSESRTIGILPFVSILTATGIYAFLILVKNTKFLKPMLLTFILVGILALNSYKYFFIYPKTLPNNNIPFGEIIADYIKSIPLTTEVVFASFDWGEWGQPEPESIYYSRGILSGRENILTKKIKNCNEIAKDKTTIIIVNPNDKRKIGEFLQCFPAANVTTYKVEENQAIFTTLMVK